MDKLLQQFSITQISQKTHISPIILEKLKNNDFSKMSKIKAVGFIKILEEEYPEFDYSKLKSEINEYFDTSKEEIAEIPNETKQTSSKKIYIILFLVIIGTVFLMTKLKTEQTNASQIQTNMSENLTQNNIIEKNITEENKTKKETKVIVQNIEQNKTVQENNKIQNTPKPTVKKEENLTLAIIPIKKVWFRVTYLDNLKSKEYLTKNEIDLNGSRPLFIKFGHGMVKMVYNGKTLFPDSKKITRVILEDKELNLTTKKIKEFK